MRGASALQNVLSDLDEAPLRTFIVWEPVILTDVAPPTTGVLSRISDTRAMQFWDRSRILSDLLLRAFREEWGSLSEGEEVDEGSIVWDYVLIFPPGPRWDRTLPRPDFAGGPVVMVMDEVRSRLSSFNVQ